ncbi:hypothetical protein Lfu02_24320 [Longispora fulva]|uniref:Uncharacterized protein n=1 Tax=Longispora fulva TaxID=619741 RepID=A0A8J7KSF2_9ACTN|nr:hypothetical protein [Longispora fulva]MBG6139557.1 hypothetical protein [Longispora fulva]GIG58060.1 hypothetical protein Lfu02_24320 [Longispora fulva]
MGKHSYIGPGGDAFADSDSSAYGPEYEDLNTKPGRHALRESVSAGASQSSAKKRKK